MTTANYGWLVFHVEIHLTKKLKKKNKFKIDSLRQKWFNDLYIRMRRVIRYLHAYIERTSILINMIIYQLLCVFFFSFFFAALCLSLTHSFTLFRSFHSIYAVWALRYYIFLFVNKHFILIDFMILICCATDSNLKCTNVLANKDKKNNKFKLYCGILESVDMPTCE